MSLLQATIIGLIALILTPGYLFYFDITPKAAVLLAGAAALLIFGARQRTVARQRTFGLLLLLNFASLILSTVLSSNPALSLYGSTWRRLGLVVQCAAMLFAWLVASHCTGRPERVRTILRGIALTGILSAAYGIAQYFGWDPLVPKAAYHIGEGIWTIVRPPGALGYASYFATWLLVTIFLCLAMAATETGTLWRRVAIAAALLALVAMLLTGTRAAVLGLLAGGAVWLYWRGFRSARRLLAIAAALALCGAAFYFSPPGRQMRSRARWFSEDPWGGARPLLWRDSLRMASHRLAAGYGPEVFYGAFPRFESKELSRAYPDFAHESPHNIFLDVLVAQGIPGLAILAGLCAIGFAAAWRLNRAQPAAARCLAAALAAGIASQQFTAFTAPTAVIFFTVIALILAHSKEAELSRPHVVFAAAAPLVALALLYAALRLTVADHALAQSRRALESGDIRASVTAYENYRRWRLPGASADLWYSRAWLDLAHKTSDINVLAQCFAQAEDFAFRATETAEDPFDAWYNLAQIYALHNDYAGTEKSLRAAIARHPTWFKPHWTLAQVLQMQSRLEEARMEAALALEYDAGKHPEVAQTLESLRP